MSNLDRIIADAAAEMDRRMAHHYHRSMKDAARRVLTGDPALNVRERPLLIARRYIRFLAHVRRQVRVH